jgi:hypothetical protein
MSISAFGLGDFTPVRRQPGQPARYTNGGSSKLASGGEPDDAIVGGWSRKDLLKMNDCFVAAMELAIAAGKERRPGEGRARAA